MDYAKFLLHVRGNPQAAMDVARQALNIDCEDSASRQVLGLAAYVMWANSSAAQRQQALNQARVYLPAGPNTLYLLAGSERTVVAAKRLIAEGEKIDQLDNDRLTALAHALQNHDLPAARRLLKLGANPGARVGIADIPVALLPIIEGEVDSVRMLQRAGVNYSKLRFQGASAMDIARQTGNEGLVELLAGDGVAL
ncbi:MAG: hypothetical protein KDI32_10050 [Pseudomonadales bacterium]|nr:hypothetical protein [Pseudomonadales bacterium]